MRKKHFTLLYSSRNRQPTRFALKVVIGIEGLAPEEQHVYSTPAPELFRSVRSGM